METVDGFGVAGRVGHSSSKSVEIDITTFSGKRLGGVPKLL